MGGRKAPDPASAMRRSRSRPPPSGADQRPRGIEDDLTTPEHPSAELRSELERRETEAAVLARIAHDLAAARRVEDVLPRIAVAAVQLTTGDGAYLERIDFSTNEVEVVASCGWGAPPLGTVVPYPGSLAERAVLQGEPEVIRRLDLEARPMGRFLRDSCGACAGLVSPLVSEGEALGALVVLRGPASPEFTPSNVRRIRTLCDLAAVSLRRIQLLVESERRRRRAEQAEERYRSLYYHNLNAVFLLDPHGRFTSVNPAAVRLGGYPPEEILGEPFDPLIHPEDLAKVRAEFQRVLEGTARFVALRMVRKDGRIREVEVNGVPMWIDGRTVGLFAVAQDVTERREAEEALRASEARFRSMADNAPVVLWLTNAAGSSTYLNRPWYETTGQAPDAGLGYGWLDAVHPDDREPTMRRFRAAVEQREPFRFEYRLRRRDGAYRWALVAGAPRFGRDGEVLGYVGAVIDITERREAEEALRRSELRFRVAQDLSLDAFTILRSERGEDGAVVDFVWDYANPAAARILRRPPDTLVGGRLLEILPGHVENSDLFQRYVHVVETGRPHDYELYYDADGIRGWFRNMAIKLGDGVAVTFRDITEQKDAQAERERLIAELRVERSRLAGLFELAPAFMIVLRGPDHVVEMTNPEAYELVGERDLIGRPLREAVPELEAEGHIERLDRVYHTNEPYTGREVRFRLRPRPDAPAEDVFANFVFLPVTDPAGNVTGIFVHGVDVTDVMRARQLAERARRAAVEANAAKSEFLANMSHELRTPLNAILGFSELLAGEVVGPMNSKQKDQIARIRESGRHLLELIEQVLSLSRIEAGREQLEPERFDAVALAGDIAAMLRPLAEEQGLELRLERPDRALEMDTDPAKLRQVLLNLLGNAIKFTERGRVELAVEGRDEDVLFHIRDTGPGIAPDDRERIFEPFTQVEVGPARQRTGTGLGLAVSRDLARLLGGDITLESEPGKGSTFTVRLPRRAPRETPRRRERARGRQRSRPT